MHTLILGKTGCGKTTLAQHMSRALLERGRRVVVVDAMCVGWPPGCCLTRSVDLARSVIFEQYLRGPIHVIVDESLLTIDRYDITHQFLATSSRHYGCNVTFIAHSPTTLPPVMRTQTDRAYVFLLDEDEMLEVAKIFARREILDCPRMERFEYLIVDKFGDQPYRKGKVSLCS